MHFYKFDMYLSYFEGCMSSVLIKRNLIFNIWDHVLPISANVDPLHFSCNSNYAYIYFRIQPPPLGMPLFINGACLTRIDDVCICVAFDDTVI